MYDLGLQGVAVVSSKVKMLWVGNGQVGLVGLDEVLEQTKAKALTGEAIKQFLLNETRKRNYVPESAEDEYAEALMREYRRYCGESVDEVPPGVLFVEVLGPGCPECDHMELEVKNVLSDLGIGGHVEHVRDREKMKKYKVFGGPGLVINGKLKAAGRVPSRKELEKWLKEAEVK